ncbi:unnamed protein product [Linum tenue]|uniref:Plant basic secretory protein (BSP) family protein n=5 Tax=Linum tenue TaxID=586396 RepID=A0AAV0MHN2_9ROSI|nr:unnamed protein product [Linum tenue]
MTTTITPSRYLFTLSLSLLLSLSATHADDGGVTYSITNNVPATKGGSRFRYRIGAVCAREAMVSATSFIWLTFGQANTPKDRKPVSHVRLSIDAMDGGGISSYTPGVIHISATYLGDYEGDVAREMTGLIYHEMTHVWQWDGNGQAPPGLVSGIADFVRLKSGHGPGNWAGPGKGERWDEGYEVTARFLDYCESLKEGFVGELNRRMRFEYKQNFFKHLLGKSIHELWAEYKNKFKA